MYDKSGLSNLNTFTGFGIIYFGLVIGNGIIMFYQRYLNKISLRLYKHIKRYLNRLKIESMRTASDTGFRRTKYYTTHVLLETFYYNFEKILGSKEIV